MRNLIVTLVLAAVSVSALAADAAERKFISAGMDEGQVLVKIGKPDYESVVSGNGAYVVGKKWTYLPAPRDEQTMTVITITNGVVGSVERTISR